MGGVSLPENESDSVHFSKRMKVCRKTMETMSDESEHSGNESLPLLSQEEDSKDIPSESQEDHMSSKVGELAAKSLDAEEYTEEASRPIIEQINHSGETSEPEILERNGSLNLQSILSRKTLDDIWKDIQHRLNEGVVGVNEEVPDHMVGSMTLEDFLVKVGVVKEDVSTPNDQAVNLYRGIYNEEFIQMHHDDDNMQDIGGHEAILATDLMSQKTEHDSKDNIISGPNGGVSKARVRLQEVARHEARKRATIASSNSSCQDGLEGNICGDWANTSGAGFYMCQMVPGGSVNAISSGHEMLMDHTQAPRRGAETDVIGVADPRQRRMIRNRESAARSRARKQAYTAELEKEVETLKEENARLRRQEVERAFEWNLKIMNHLFSNVSMPGTRMLRRSQTNPW